MGGIVTQNVLGNSGLVKAVEAGGGSWVEIKTLTSDGSDATLSFVNGTDDVVLDSTYPIYVFRFTNIHPETNNTDFTFNFSVDSGSNYNVTKTTTTFRAAHDDGDGTAELAYYAANDLAQGTGFQSFSIGGSYEGDNDSSVSGTLYLFNPSSTVFVKHFISTTNGVIANDYSVNGYVAGYGNTTSAIDAVQFKMSADEIQAGKIKLFGLKDS